MARVIGAATLVRDLGEWRGGSARRAAYVALAEGIRLLVHDGRLPLGVALPSERDLSAAAGVSRTTVTSAYGLLRERGYLVSRQGSRSTVAMPAGGERSDGENRHGGKPTGVSLVAMLDDGPAQAVDLTFAAMAAPDGIAEA